MVKTSKNLLKIVKINNGKKWKKSTEGALNGVQEI
jgi:hypothetical protein